MQIYQFFKAHYTPTIDTVDTAGLLSVKAIKAYSSITEKSKEIQHSTASVKPHPKQLLLTVIFLYKRL